MTTEYLENWIIIYFFKYQKLGRFSPTLFLKKIKKSTQFSHKDIRNQNRQLSKKNENCLTLERTSLKVFLDLVIQCVLSVIKYSEDEMKLPLNLSRRPSVPSSVHHPSLHILKDVVKLPLNPSIHSSHHPSVIHPWMASYNNPLQCEG